MCLYCISKVSDCFSKSCGISWFPAYALSIINKMHEELQRAITLTELAPSHFISNTNVHFVDINVFGKFDKIPSLPVQDIKFFQRKVQCVYIVWAKYLIVSAKAVVQVNFPAYALLYINKMHWESQRAITLTELVFSPFYSNTNFRLVDINVFAKFDEIPSLPVHKVTD